MIINTYLLRPRETVCFVDQRLSMFPEAKPRETSTVKSPQSTKPSTTQRAHLSHRVLHRGLTSYIFLWFLRNGLLLKRALKSGGHHPEKFKMAAKFRAILRLSGVWMPLCTGWDKILSKCIEAFTPPHNYQSALRFFRRVSTLCSTLWLSYVARETVEFLHYHVIRS